jgi:hypothetical protein
LLLVTRVHSTNDKPAARKAPPILAQRISHCRDGNRQWPHKPTSRTDLPSLSAFANMRASRKQQSGQLAAMTSPSRRFYGQLLKVLIYLSASGAKRRLYQCTGISNPERKTCFSRSSWSRLPYRRRLGAMDACKRGSHPLDGFNSAVGKSGRCSMRCAHSFGCCDCIRESRDAGATTCGNHLCRAHLCRLPDIAKCRTGHHVIDASDDESLPGTRKSARDNRAHPSVRLRYRLCRSAMDHSARCAGARNHFPRGREQALRTSLAQRRMDLKHALERCDPMDRGHPHEWLSGPKDRGTLMNG